MTYCSRELFHINLIWNDAQMGQWTWKTVAVLEKLHSIHPHNTNRCYRFLMCTLAQPFMCCRLACKAVKLINITTTVTRHWIAHLVQELGYRFNCKNQGSILGRSKKSLSSPKHSVALEPTQLPVPQPHRAPSMEVKWPLCEPDWSLPQH